MKRNENYRKGDRAEHFGVFLLKAFCAVAEIPRQEDFGLVDAVATILRRERGFLHPGDSFLLQFKSRTERTIEYLGDKFVALFDQELPLVIARVDLLRARVEMHTLGLALSHPNVNQFAGVVAHLRRGPTASDGLIGNIFHLILDKPILQWSVSDTERPAFTDKAYLILKEWFELERWNRRYRKAGIVRQIRWETNEVPTRGAEIQMVDGHRYQESLGEVVPSVQLLATYGNNHPSLRAATSTILEWLRQQGVEGDPTGSREIMRRFRDGDDRLRTAMKLIPAADLAITCFIFYARADHLDFLLMQRGKNGTATAKRYTGSPEEIREKGIILDMTLNDNIANITIGLSPTWFKNGQWSAIDHALVQLPAPEPGATAVALLQRQ